ncbi:MAG: hypothetical protein HY275_08165 [Gemmatimonadetes bacterium]|nr:hypothetical protein [Gemmatimonadota bacterium]
MLRHVPTLLILLAVAGCASAGSSGSSRPEGEAIVVQNTQNIIQTGGANNIAIGSGMTSIIQAATTHINLTADKVFGALSTTYESLSIPVTTMVTKDRMLGNLEFKARARLGSLPMRRLVDCGMQLGEPNADSYQIILSVSSEVKDNGDGSSTLATVVQATGRPVQFSGADVRCTTLGELEKRIATIVQAKALGER